MFIDSILFCLFLHAYIYPVMQKIGSLTDIAKGKVLYLEHQVVVIIFSISAGESEVAISQAVHFVSKKQVERLPELLTSLLEGFYQSLALELLRFQLALQICLPENFVTRLEKMT
jgi:hypothetical protein